MPRSDSGRNQPGEGVRQYLRRARADSYPQAIHEEAQQAQNQAGCPIDEAQGKGKSEHGQWDQKQSTGDTCLEAVLGNPFVPANLSPFYDHSVREGSGEWGADYYNLLAAHLHSRRKHSPKLPTPIGMHSAPMIASFVI